MKKLTKILALALMMALVVTVFAACGDKKEGAETADNAGEAASAKGETQTWGNITIFVPDDYKLTGGDMFDAENPDKLTLNTKSDSSFEYVMVSLIRHVNSTKVVKTLRSLQAPTSGPALLTILSALTA